MAEDVTPVPRTALDRMLRPRSVAVVGASDDPGRIGGRPLSYLRRAGFAGPVYPVNPKRETVQGIASYSGIADLPEAVDAAIIALPAPLVPAAVQACADKGVGGAIIFSAGFAEVGAEGAAVQADLAAIARGGGLRIMGPNCLGSYDSELGFFATFTATLEDGFPEPGVVGLASQSGAYGSHVSVLARNRGLKLRSWITTGNECDLAMPEALAWLIEDPRIKVVMAYAEGITDPGRLLAALDRARALGKAVVFMKVGTSEIGAAAVASHTASLAGSDRVYDAVLRQYGAYRARDTGELLDVAYAAAGGVFPAHDGLGLTTISGGVGAQMADAAADFGLAVAPMPKDAEARIKERLPFAVARNPVDFTGHFYNDKGLFAACLEAMLAEGGYAAVIAFLTSGAAAPGSLEPTLEAFAKARAEFPDRVLVSCMVGPPEVVARYEAAGCLVFEDPTRAVRAVAALRWFARRFAVPRDPGEAPGFEGPPLPAGALGEQQAKQILAAAGIAMVEDRLVTGPDEAVAAAEELGWPLVMKIASPDILHKTEAGGVRLGIAHEAGLRQAWTEILETVRVAAPGARIEGLLLSPQAPPGGIETILGVQRDPVFGPMVMLGLGGILVEVLGDVALRHAPFGPAEARAMIAELKGRALLDGARGRPPADQEALVGALVALSHFAASHGAAIESLDINPFLVLPDGQGALGLDAAIVRWVC